MSLESSRASSLDQAGRGVICVTAALLTIGVVMIASTGASLDRPPSDAALWKSPLVRQVGFAVLGFMTLVMVSRAGLPLVTPAASSTRAPIVLPFLMLLVTCGLLAAVLVPGIGLERNGARRWLPLGPPSAGLVFQPSEIAKLALVVFMAAFLARRAERVRSFWTTVLPGLIVVGLVAGLVALEDFGTAALLALVGGGMLLAAGCRLAHLLLMAMPGVIAAAYLVICEPYRMTRLSTFFDIWKDPQGAGYHPIQSLATISSGGWFGRGLGAGIQKYGYLPAIQTDFIFAGICEEMGALGGMVVILLFLTLLALGFQIVRHTPAGAPRLLAFGATLAITLQAVINIAVVTVMAPTKGIALPFVSAGGSGIVLLAALVGLMAWVANRPAQAAGMELPFVREGGPSSRRGTTWAPAV